MNKFTYLYFNELAISCGLLLVYCSVTSATVIADFKLRIDWIKVVTWY